MTVPPLGNERPDWDAIARHRAGETVGDEARRITAWLNANPLDARMLAALDEAIGGALATNVTADTPDVEAALRSVHARMHQGTPTRVLAFPAAERSGRGMRWLAGSLAAAAAVAALAVGLGRTRSESHPGSVGARGAAGSVITTAVGVRDSVRLPDGTQVILAPASRLAVSPSFGISSREVTIHGMAWLAVHHDAATPFTVRAGDAVIRDVGTAFTVRTGDGAPDAVSVIVSEGSVELRGASASGAAPVTLAAGDRGRLSAGQVTAQRGSATDADAAWTRGRLVFRDTPLESVRADLRRWYGVDLQLADRSLAGRRLTATFDDEPIDRVLQVIALALGAQVERHDSVAVLRTAPMR